jgi:hypothetical protein
VRAAEELVIGCGEDVDVLQILVNWARAYELRSIDEHERANCAGDLAESPDIGPVTSRALDRTGNIHGFQTTVTEGNLAHLVALVGQEPPREVIGAVLAFPDDDVRTRRCRTEL